MRGYREREPFILGAAVIVLLIALWEAVPSLVTLSRGMALFFTTPSKVAATFWRMLVNGELNRHLYVSGLEFVVGLGLAILVGLPLGLLMGRSKTLDALLDPYVNALNATPRLVFLPLLILWFGLGIWSKIMIVFAGAVFPLLINTYVGVRNVNRVLIDVVRSFCANERQVMRIVVVPNSVPYIIAGLRLAIGRAILGVVVGEFFGATEGLGFLIAEAASNYVVDRVFVGVLVFMGMSLVLTMSVKKIESNLTRWRPEGAKTF